MIKSSLFAAGLVSFMASTASADVIAGWSMPTAVTASTIGTSYNYGAANSGALTSGSMLSGYHAVAATTWSSPSGNGSTYSLSSNNWSTGDYYQVMFSTSGYSDISVNWDQTRSSTGPGAFGLSMSTNSGATFTNLLPSYTVNQAGVTGSGTTTWNPTTNQTGFTTTIVIGVAAANYSQIVLRFSSLSTTASAGSGRVDNISVNGALIPAPGAIALIGLAGLVSRRRR